MSRKQVRTILEGIVHDGIDVSILSIKARQEMRDAIDVLLRLQAAPEGK